MASGSRCGACHDLRALSAGVQGRGSRLAGHLVHVSAGASLGGTERRLLELFDGLRERHWRVTLILLDDGALHDAAHQRGVPAICLPMRTRWDIGILPRALRRVAQLQPDVLQSDAVRSHLVARFCAVRLRRPHVSVVATDYWRDPVGTGRRRPLQQLLDLSTTWASADFLVANRSLAHRLERSGVSGERIAIIRHGLRWPDPAELREQVSRLRATWGLEDGRPVVVTVAMLRPQKRLEDLLDAWTIVSRARPDTRLAIVGGTFAGQEGYLTRMKRDADRLGIADSLLWVGLAASGIPWCALADVVVLPSLSEGMPRVILEAMGAGRPVVASDVMGTRELVEPGVTGWLVPPRAPRALAQSLLWVLEHPAERRRMGEAARQRFEGAYRFQSMVDAHAARYERLVRIANRRDEGPDAGHG